MTDAEGVDGVVSGESPRGLSLEDPQVEVWLEEKATQDTGQ